MSDAEFQSTSPLSTLQALYYNSYMASGRLPPPMPTAELCQLWCLVEGEPTSDLFRVVANVGESIYQLKKLIQGEKKDLCDMDASRLVLWKVRMF